MSPRISVVALAVAILGCRQDQPPAPIAPFVIDEAVQLRGQVLAPAAVKARVARVNPPGFDGVVYCAYQTLGTDNDRAYLWVLCDEYAVGHDEELSASSVPIVLEPDAIHVPGDGSLFVQDIKRMFPARLIPQILADTPLHNARVAALEAAIARERHPRTSDPVLPENQH
jgi:hypothetical protein